MPHNLKRPDDLDEEGQALWEAFAETRERFNRLRREFKAMRSAMRQNIRLGHPSDPSVTNRYDAMREALAEAEAERRIAERAYHAYRRAWVARHANTYKRAPRPRTDEDDSS
jgi:hypothetical protein